MRIQHNIPAMNSYRNYGNNVSKVAKNLEKLSTGYKINRAGDDAAGLAISEKMRIQITGLEKAQDNAKAGINLVQTAEGALTEVHDMLNRMYDLAEQSANGTFDDTTDRRQLQKEVDSLRTEIDRIADSTNYNGIKLLDGSMENKTVAGGAINAKLSGIRDGQLAGKDPQPGIFSVDLTNASLVNSSTTESATVKFVLGPAAEEEEGTGTAEDTDEEAYEAAEFEITVAANTTLAGAALAKAVVDAIGKTWTDQDGNTYDVSHEQEKGVIRLTMQDLPRKSMTESGINLTLDPKLVADEEEEGAAAEGDEEEATSKIISNQGNQWNFKVDQEPVASGDGRIYAQSQLAMNKNVVKDGGTLTIGGETYVFAIGKESVYKDYANVIDLTDKTAKSAELYRVAAARLTQVAANNKSFYVGTNFDLTAPVVTFTEKEGAIDYTKNNLAGKNGTSPGTHTTDDAKKDNWAGLILTGNANASASTHGLTLQIGDTAESFNQLNVSIADMHCASLGLSKIDISMQGNAQEAMDAIKAATNMVSDVRGSLGAIQNRLDHTINNLSVAQENIQDAESNIRDVDVAKEMMAYTKNNILVQSAQAMLAQANQLPQGVLQLLG